MYFFVYWKEVLKYSILYANKFDNLDESNKFLENHNSVKWIQKEIKNLKKKIWMIP